MEEENRRTRGEEERNGGGGELEKRDRMKVTSRSDNMRPTRIQKTGRWEKMSFDVVRD